jgi:hypothetical protein
MDVDLTELSHVDKPRKQKIQRLADVALKGLADTFARQGFAASALVTRWHEIVGAEVAAHAEPIKIQWTRAADGAPVEPATLVLRVEGPMGLEIQQQSAIVIERVNRFFGWQAVGRLAYRQAPLRRREKPKPREPDHERIASIAAELDAIDDPDLRTALARLGTAVKGGS